MHCEKQCLFEKEITKLAKEVLLTQSGYENLVNELEYLKTEKRAELAEKIKASARENDIEIVDISHKLRN